MLDGDRHIYLVDFGLSKENVTTPTTGSNTFCGTTEYLAPEILNYKEHGTAVDYWSFGMLFYEMLTGLPPWYSYTQEDVVRGILSGDLEYPREMSVDAISLCKGLLDRDPEKRFGAREIMAHPFFSRVDWERLRAKRIASPFRPPATTETCNFDPQFTSVNVEVERYPQRPPPDDKFSPFYFDRSAALAAAAAAASSDEQAPAGESGKSRLHRLRTSPTADEYQSQSSAADSATEMRMVENELVESAKRALRV